MECKFGNLCRAEISRNVQADLGSTLSDKKILVIKKQILNSNI